MYTIEHAFHQRLEKLLKEQTSVFYTVDRYSSTYQSPNFIFEIGKEHMYSKTRMTFKDQDPEKFILGCQKLLDSIEIYYFEFQNYVKALPYSDLLDKRYLEEKQVLYDLFKDLTTEYLSNLPYVQSHPDAINLLYHIRYFLGFMFSKNYNEVGSPINYYLAMEIFQIDLKASKGSSSELITELENITGQNWWRTYPTSPIIFGAKNNKTLKKLEYNFFDLFTGIHP